MLEIQEEEQCGRLKRNILLIDSVVYDSLEKHFGNIVDNWEFTKNSYKRIEEKENEHGTEDTV